MSLNQPIRFNASGTETPRHPSPEDLVLFAMQLLAAAENSSIAHHLKGCADCRAELGRIHSDLALCAATVDLESPSEAARERLLHQVAREKKILAMPAPSAVQAAATTADAPPLASFGRTASILTMEDRAPRRTGHTILAFAGWAAAAALAVAFAVQHQNTAAMRNTLATQTGELERLTVDAASAHELMDALTDPKAVRVSLATRPQPKAQPSGAVTYNAAKGSLIFLASSLDPLQTYKTYELWVIPADGGKPIPAGTFHPDDQGNASVIMPDLPKGVTAKAFGVTIEAAGGAPAPTLPIILAGG